VETVDSKMTANPSLLPTARAAMVCSIVDSSTRFPISLARPTGQWLSSIR
jgi:hypothetical protein